MKRKVPSTEPCGISKKIFRNSLKLTPIFVFFPFVKIKLSDLLSNPNAFNLAISNSCGIPSKAFHTYVNTTAKTKYLNISAFSRFLNHQGKKVLCL